MTCARLSLAIPTGPLAAVVLLCAGLLSLAGCSDSAQSRGNTNGTNSPKAVAAGATDATEVSAARNAENPDSKKPVANNIEQVAVDSAAAVRSPAAPARKTTREITFDTVKFDIEKGEAFNRSMLTPEIEKLDGERVRVRGYMLPSFQQSGITQFVLVRDNLECCFGPGAALFDCIIVEMVGDATCEFSVRPIAVEGIFTVREFKGPDDTHLAIYHLDGERVR